jgi:hypothetical protein
VKQRSNRDANDKIGMPTTKSGCQRQNRDANDKIGMPGKTVILRETAILGKTIHEKTVRHEKW